MTFATVTAIVVCLVVIRVIYCLYPFTRQTCAVQAISAEEQHQKLKEPDDLPVLKKRKFIEIVPADQIVGIYSELCLAAPIYIDGEKHFPFDIDIDDIEDNDLFLVIDDEMPSLEGKIWRACGNAYKENGLGIVPVLDEPVMVLGEKQAGRSIEERSAFLRKEADDKKNLHDLSRFVTSQYDAGLLSAQVIALIDRVIALENKSKDGVANVMKQRLDFIFQKAVTPMKDAGVLEVIQENAVRSFSHMDEETVKKFVGERYQVLLDATWQFADWDESDSDY